MKLDISDLELRGNRFEGNTVCVNYDAYRVDERNNLIREESRNCTHSGAVLDPIATFAQGKAKVRSYALCIPSSN